MLPHGCHGQEIEGVRQEGVGTDRKNDISGNVVPDFRQMQARAVGGQSANSATLPGFFSYALI
jgi:hypothetical protein